MRSLISALTVFICCGLAACGTYTPSLEEYHQDSSEAGNMVHAVLLNVTCEIRDSLHDVMAEDLEDYRDGILPKPLAQFLEDWGVQIALSFTIEEKGSTAVGATGLPPSPVSAVASLAGSLTGSATATRIDKINAFHAVREFSRTGCGKAARPGGPFLMQSDLKLKEWLKINTTLKGTELVTFPSINEGPYKQDVISHQIKFVIENTGSFTPSWKLTRALVNQGGDFLSASRTRTHDLTITLGPLDKAELKKGRIAPSKAAENSALASDIGTSVANNLRSGALTRPSLLSPFGF